MITYSKDKNNKSKNKYKKYETLTAILQSIDTLVIVATASSSITPNLTGFGLIVIPKSTGITCGLSVSNKVIYEVIINKYKKKQKNHMKKINKQKTLSINYTENLYKIL